MLRLMNIDALKRRLRAGDRNQKGAMAVMSLAAILIIIMVGLTLYDVAELGVEKTHLQTATDSAAYSQATVQAKSMNMIAFTNVGKRMTVGMVNTYINLNQFIHNLAQIATQMSVLCTLVGIFVPAILTFCSQLAQAASGANQVYSGENSPRGDVYSKGGQKCYMQKWGCSWSGCGWSCMKDYLPIREWAAPVSDYQWLGLPPAILPCGKVLPPTGVKWGPLSCANGDTRKSWNAGQLVSNYYGRDLLGMDNYQRYMAALAPYWAWTEGTMRGLANAAPVTVSYPMPDFAENQEHVAQVPVARGEWSDTCERGADQDRGLTSYMGVDIMLKNLISGISGGMPSGGGASMVGGIVAMVWAIYGSMEMGELSSGSLLNQMLPRGWEFLCRDVTSQIFSTGSGGGGPWGGFGGGGGGDYVASYRDYGRPFLLHEYNGNEQQWLMDSSTLTFGFRPNANRFGEGRDKFFVAGDHDSWVPDAGGMWAMSRSEMSYQGEGSPSAWSPGWTARMRPVALPGEWQRYGDFTVGDAFNEVVDVVGHTTAVAHTANSNGSLITHPHSGTGMITELGQEMLAIQQALNGLDNERMEGLAR